MNFRVNPGHVWGGGIKGEWHVLADDLAAMYYRMSVVEWALFDRWRQVWAAAA